MCNITNESCHVTPLQGLAYTPLFLLGFFIHVAALCAFVAKQISWTDTHIYMLNLMIADIAFIIFLPFRIYDSFFCLEKTLLCTFLLYTHFINMYAGILTMTAISVHRYLAIRFPLQASSWRKKKESAIAVCLLIWGGLVTIAFVFREDNYPHNLWTCYERCKDKPLNLKILLLMVSFGYLVPLFIIVFCSSQVIYIFKRDGKSTSLQQNITGIITTNMVVFIVCFTPIHLGFLINYYYPPPEDWQSTLVPAHVYLLVSEWISSTNCCFDSISYYFLLKGFFSPTISRGRKSVSNGKSFI